MSCCEAELWHFPSLPVGPGVWLWVTELSDQILIQGWSGGGRHHFGPFIRQVSVSALQLSLLWGIFMNSWIILSFGNIDYELHCPGGSRNPNEELQSVWWVLFCLWLCTACRNNTSSGHGGISGLSSLERWGRVVTEGNGGADASQHEVHPAWRHKYVEQSYRPCSDPPGSGFPGHRHHGIVSQVRWGDLPIKPMLYTQQFSSWWWIKSPPLF